MEYDFVVAPSADPNVIKFAFEGADKVEFDAQGDLVLHTKGGEVRLLKPRIYQKINGTKQTIPGHYALLEPEARDAGRETRKVGFQVAAYDTSRPLIIDPVLSYSTYLGGSNTDVSEDIAVDSSGNVYVTGRTNSTNFPTASPFQAANAGGSDAFVTKVNAAGSALVYSTYLGGGSSDRGHGIAMDASGNAYVTGVSDGACQEDVTSFFLVGELADGTPIEGADEVSMVRGR